MGSEPKLLKKFEMHWIIIISCLFLQCFADLLVTQQANECCNTKTVGSPKHLFENATIMSPKNCKKSCVYLRNTARNPRICFTYGGNQVKCEKKSTEESEGGGQVFIIFL